MMHSRSNFEQKLVKVFRGTLKILEIETTIARIFLIRIMHLLSPREPDPFNTQCRKKKKKTENAKATMLRVVYGVKPLVAPTPNLQQSASLRLRCQHHCREALCSTAQFVFFRTFVAKFSKLIQESCTFKSCDQCITQWLRQSNVYSVEMFTSFGCPEVTGGRSETRQIFVRGPRLLHRKPRCCASVMPRLHFGTDVWETVQCPLT